LVLSSKKEQTFFLEKEAKTFYLFSARRARRSKGPVPIASLPSGPRGHSASGRAQ
jgi:hypothetical protein